MGIIDRKIATWTNPIENEADQPQRTAEDMKGIFDANSNQLKTALNGFIDDLLSTIGSSQIGAEAIAGLDGATVKEQITALMLSKIASTAFKALRLNEGYLEYTTDGTTWIKMPTWGGIAGLQVEATTRPPGYGATAEVVPSGGSALIKFGIPRGADGADAVSVAVNGMFYMRVDDNGHLKVGVADGASQPPLSIDENGHLIYTI